MFFTVLMKHILGGEVQPPIPAQVLMVEFPRWLFILLIKIICQIIGASFVFGGSHTGQAIRNDDFFFICQWAKLKQVSCIYCYTIPFNL
jgi:hypothetical protein